MSTINESHLNVFSEDFTVKDFFITKESDIESYIEDFEQSEEVLSTAFVSDNPIELTYRVPFFRLLYVLEGSIGITIDQKELVFFEGGVIIANPNTHIVYRGTSSHTQVATIIFKRNFFSPTFLADLTGLPLFYNFLNQGLSRDYSKSNYFFFQQSLNNFSHYLLIFLLSKIVNPKTKSIVKHSALFLLLSELDETKDRTLVLEQSALPSNLFIGEILNQITHHCDTISLEELARTYNLHPNSISSMLKRETKKNFSQHLTDVRLERATYYLRNSSLPIQDISEKIGYKEKSYFFRLFKKNYGVSPNQYRKKNTQISPKESR